ncbi:MAG: hypothetical protein ACKV1O_28040 [Saprospiraceae bacterium]
MIKIDKGDSPPRLFKQKKILNESLIKKYLQGDRQFKFKDAYCTDEVKNALKACQYNKCCFSEAKFVGDDSHVEHFRPKGRVDDYPNGKSYYPGYYWIAYEWSNLFLCKSRINSSCKRNFFPLFDNNQRNRSHLDTNIEEPMLVDPSFDNPRDHIEFIGDEPVGKSEKGHFTITLLRLRTSEFEEARRTRLRLIKLLRISIDNALNEGIDKNHPDVADIINELKQAVLSHSEFSSMVKDFLKDWPHLE